MLIVFRYDAIARFCKNTLLSIDRRSLRELDFPNTTQLHSSRDFALLISSHGMANSFSFVFQVGNYTRCTIETQYLTTKFH